jgi:hypothetical protein
MRQDTREGNLRHAQLCIEQAEEMTERQELLIMRLKREGRSTDSAVHLLNVLHDSLARMKVHLEYLKTGK